MNSLQLLSIIKMYEQSISYVVEEGNTNAPDSFKIRFLNDFPGTAIHARD